jgi:endonuclease/exonuclease/phosphatase family metal-dependent hydrolase
MRVLTYNVHSCRGVDGVDSPARIAEVIAAARADVACLQELDSGRLRTGRVHQAERVAQALAMTFHFHPAIRVAEEEYGDAILSAPPMRLIRAAELPRPWGAREPRGALWVEIEAEGARWQVLNTHLGLGRGVRRAQARALGEWVSAARARGPVVLCGDLNSRPGSAVHALVAPGLLEVQLSTRGFHLRTFATRLPWICLDYIYVSDDLEVRCAEVLTSPLARLASDHFPLLAELGLRSSRA